MTKTRIEGRAFQLEMYRVVLHDFGLEFHQEFTGSLGSPSLNGVYVRPLECAIPALSIFLPEKTKKGKEKKEKSDEAAAKAAEKAVIKEAQKDKTDTLSLSTGKDSEAKLKISKVVVEETKGETVEEYVVDLAERKIFLGGKKSQNDFGVFDEIAKKKFGSVNEVLPIQCARPALSIFLPVKEGDKKDGTDTLSLSTGIDSQAQLEISELIVKEIEGENIRGCRKRDLVSG